MSELKPDENRQAHRSPIVVHRACSLGVIAFKHLEWKDHMARIVDLSRIGVGIESEERIEPGFVWFRDRVGGHKGGILMWSRPQGRKYRSGVRFVSLTHDEEQYVQEQMTQTRSHAPVRDPEAIIMTIIESLKKEERGSN